MRYAFHQHHYRIDFTSHCRDSTGTSHSRTDFSTHPETPTLFHRPCRGFELSGFIPLLNSGFAVLVLEGCQKALVFGVQGYDKRSVSTPSGENNIFGAKDGFVEVVRTNMSLIRRRMKSPFLKMELGCYGDKSQTDLCICYLYDRVPQALIQKIKRQLGSMKLESILSSGYVRPFLKPAAPLSSIPSALHSVQMFLCKAIRRAGWHPN